jgi:MYXO-CTERM domain-containing protein
MRLGRFSVGAAACAAACATAFAPATAAAEAPRRTVAASEPAELLDVIAGPANADGYQLGRQLLPAAGPAAGIASLDGTAPAVAASRTVYLNKNGVTLTPGTNDSRLNRSTVVTQQVAIPPWNAGASTWSEIVTCMREVFAPFNISIVDTDPGDVPHIEAVFGGTPALLGVATNLAGVSPFTSDCAVIENSIVFTFTGALPADPRLLCEVQAQEVAHSYGLDHVLLTADLMTYLPYDGRRWFQNMNASCGEDKARPCGLNGSTCRQTQNAVSLLIERVGMKGQAGDAVAPTVAITSPYNGETVPPTFAVKFNASDNAKVLMASLYVDGVASGSVVMAPLSIAMPGGLTEGAHKLRVVATDGINESAQEIAVTVKKGAAPPAGQEDDVMGGCSAGRGGGPGTGAGAGLALALGAALGRRRRRRPRC